MDALVTVLLLGLAAAPFWAAIVPPMTDVSQHILVSRIVGQYGNPALHYSTFFSMRWTGAPTDLFYALFTLLQKAAGPFVDTKIYLSFWVAALWASVWYLARTMGTPRPWVAATFVLPLAFCWYAYMGFLPFLMALPLFAVSVAIWLRPMRPMLKVPLLWVVLVMLFGFHVVGAAAAGATIGLIALVDAITGAREGRRGLALAAIAVAPLPILVLRYLTGSHAPAVHASHFNLLRNGLDVLHYTGASLARPVLYVMLVWIFAVGTISVANVKSRRVPGLILASALMLCVIAVLMPVSLGSLWPAGPRLLPFALILCVAALAFSARTERWAVSALAVLMVTLSALTFRKARSLDGDFRDFLSGADHVAPGAKVLPIIVDPAGGSRDVKPFWSLASSYTILRGGANPYVFAEPYITTGASPIHFKDHDQFRYAYLLAPPTNASAYAGVSCCYDYVLMWGRDSTLRSVLGAELTEIYTKGNLHLFQSPKAK